MWYREFMQTLTIFTTGLTKGDPGAAAVGVHVTDASGAIVLQHNATIGNATELFAQYQAVATALELVQAKFGADTRIMQCELRLTSVVVKQQLNSEAMIEDPRLVPHFMYIHNLRVEHFPQLTLSHAVSEHDQEAHSLASAALDGK